MLDLFSDTPPWQEPLAPGAVVLRRFARERAPALLQAIADVASQSPFRQMVTPGGYTMSVAMTNCGALGWTTDRQGYLYAPVDPVTDQTWPPMPAVFHELALAAAAAGGYPEFSPDACLINRYCPGARRCGGLGRRVAPVLSWHSAAESGASSGNGRLSLQSHLPTGGWSPVLK